MVGSKVHTVDVRVESKVLEGGAGRRWGEREREKINLLNFYATSCIHALVYTFLMMCSVVVRAILMDLSATGTRRSWTAFSTAGRMYCFN